jgi:hypothetical protein
MISLSDAELDVVCRMARDLPLGKHDTYLERIAAILGRRSGRPTNADVLEAAAEAAGSLTPRESAA